MRCSALFSPFLPAMLVFVPVAQAGFASPAMPVVDGVVSCTPALMKRSNGVYSVLEAAAVGDMVALQARLAEGDNPSQVDEKGNSPLHYAAKAPSPRALELLLAAGADPAARDARGRTPRQLCRHAAFMEILRVAEQKREQELLLCSFVAKGDEAAVRAELARGTNPNAKWVDNERSILLQAVALRHGGVARALLEAGADVNAVTVHERHSALHLAAALGDVEMIRLLLEVGANPVVQAANGAYPLHDAIWEKHLPAVRALLPAYAAVNCDPQGGPHGSPLSMAISYGRAEVLRAFLEAGYNPNAVHPKGTPALILAVCSGKPACVSMLLEAGADKHLKDRRGKTAADYAPAEMMPLLN